MPTRESHVNGNKSKTWEWGWEGMGMLKAIPAHLYFERHFSDIPYCCYFVCAANARSVSDS